jgi:hypothetical protein
MHVVTVREGSLVRCSASLSVVCLKYFRLVSLLGVQLQFLRFEETALYRYCWYCFCLAGDAATHVQNVMKSASLHII